MILCAITLMALIALRFTVPRLWGNTFRATQTNEAPNHEAALLVIADGAPQQSTIRIGQTLSIENRVPRSVQVTFSLSDGSMVLHQTPALVIGSSSNASLQFATTGMWRCASDIIHACGTVHVITSENH